MLEIDRGRAFQFLWHINLQCNECATDCQKTVREKKNGAMYCTINGNYRYGGWNWLRFGLGQVLATQNSTSCEMN